MLLFPSSFVWRRDKVCTLKVIGLYVYLESVLEAKCFEFTVQILPPPLLLDLFLYTPLGKRNQISEGGTLGTLLLTPFTTSGDSGPHYTHYYMYRCIYSLYSIFQLSYMLWYAESTNCSGKIGFGFLFYIKSTWIQFRYTCLFKYHLL